MTDLMLRMIEHRVGLPDLQLRHPGQALRAVSHDPTGAAEVELADGRRLGVVQIAGLVARLVGGSTGAPRTRSADRTVATLTQIAGRHLGDAT